MHFTGDPDAYVGELVIDRRMEGRGAGRALIAAAEEWAASRGPARITLETGARNHRARRFYESAGYEEEGIRLSKPVGSAVVTRQLPQGQNQQVATLFLMVGLPGGGKTATARELAARHPALRLSPDAWMIPLFGQSEAGGKRDVLEGRLIWLALEALRLGTSVILDFGFWSRDERSALRWLARSAGASCQVVYLPVDRDTQLARIRHRQARTPEETFEVTDEEADGFRAQFEAPDGAELAGTDLAGPPPGWPGWGDWAADRWPSLAGG